MALVLGNFTRLKSLSIHLCIAKGLSNVLCCLESMSAWQLTQCQRLRRECWGQGLVQALMQSRRGLQCCPPCWQHHWDCSLAEACGLSLQQEGLQILGAQPLIVLSRQSVSPTRLRNLVWRTGRSMKTFATQQTRLRPFGRTCVQASLRMQVEIDTWESRG